MRKPNPSTATTLRIAVAAAGESATEPGVAAAGLAVLASGVVAANAAPKSKSSSTTSSSTSTTSTGTTTASSGLTTVGGILTGVASQFSDTGTGWTSYGGDLVHQVTDAGHSGAGSLEVTSAGAWKGAASPSFSVTVGDRYTATAWSLARTTSQSVGLALRFFDAQGAVITAGNQIGQGVATSTTTWQRTMPAVGFAPRGAVSGQVVFLNFTGDAGDVQLVDDLSVSRTTGVATPVAVPVHTSGNQIVDRNGQQQHDRAEAGTCGANDRRGPDRSLRESGDEEYGAAGQSCPHRHRRGSHLGRQLRPHPARRGLRPAGQLRLRHRRLPRPRRRPRP